MMAEKSTSPQEALADILDTAGFDRIPAAHVDLRGEAGTKILRQLVRGADVFT